MTKKTSTDYSKLSQQLQDILDQMESGQLDVDQSIQKYQQGIDIAKQLEEYLKSAQNNIRKVKLKNQ